MLSRFWSVLFCGLALLGAATSGVAADAPPASPPRFAIADYRVEGNTLLPAAEVQAVLAPFTGAGKDFGTVQEALEALQQAYHRRGFKTVAILIPEQELAGGTVRLTIIEPKVKSVAIEGNSFFNADNIRHSLPGLQEGTTPDLDAISASLRVANGNPAKKGTLTLRGGATPEELAATLKMVDEKPWQIGVSLDDTGNDATGDLRLGFFFSHANLFNRDHLLTLQYKTSTEHPEDVGIYAIGYRLPLYSLGDSLDLYAAYADIDSGTVSTGVVDLNVAGKGTILGARYNQNLAHRGEYEHFISYGIDYRAYENDVEIFNIPIGSDVTVHPVSLTYSGLWKGRSSMAGFHLGLARNIAGGSNGKSEDFRLVRQDASAHYTLFRFGGDFSWLLPADWQAGARLNGQYTNDSLVPGEFFGLGGAGSVRGFDERELADDRGYFTSVELRTPDLAPLLTIPKGQLRLLAFYDTGSVDRVDPLPGEINRQTIASIGGGLRFNLGRQFAAETFYGHVVDGGGASDTGDGRWHFSLRYAY